LKKKEKGNDITSFREELNKIKEAQDKLCQETNCIKEKNEELIKRRYKLVEDLKKQLYG
jgi:uncharacterized protein YoxC